MTIKEVSAYGKKLSKALNACLRTHKSKYAVTYMTTAIEFIRCVVESVDKIIHITRHTEPFFTAAFYLIYKTLYSRMDDPGRACFGSLAKYAEEKSGYNINVQAFYIEEESD